MKHLLRISDAPVKEIVQEAELLNPDCNLPEVFRKKTLITFFNEPSTRTRMSMEAAMHHLGGRVISASDAKNSTSIKKGESFKDTIRVISRYGDVLAIRDSDANWIETAQEYSEIPCINAGNGGDEHPTQALLDLYTMWRKFGKSWENLKNLRVLFLGDLRYGRTVHSLVPLLRQCGCNISYAPAAVFADYSKSYLEYKQRSPEENSYDINEVDTKNYDVLYFTRIQHERIEMDIRGEMMFTLFDLNNMKQDAIVMHPLPRGPEISREIDKDPRAVYFTDQIKNGVIVRAAIIKMLLGL